MPPLKNSTLGVCLCYLTLEPGLHQGLDNWVPNSKTGNPWKSYPIFQILTTGEKNGY